MHDKDSEGNEFFKCDFCHSGWAEDRPMVEGHQGALVCSRCLTASYSEVVHAGAGTEHLAAKCTMCLETREDPKWQSPLHEGVLICRRCIKQSAGVLEKDEEQTWRRPGGVGQDVQAGAEADEDE